MSADPRTKNQITYWPDAATPKRKRLVRMTIVVVGLTLVTLAGYVRPLPNKHWGWLVLVAVMLVLELLITMVKYSGPIGPAGLKAHIAKLPQTREPEPGEVMRADKTNRVVYGLVDGTKHHHIVLVARYLGLVLMALTSPGRTEAWGLVSEPPAFPQYLTALFIIGFSLAASVWWADPKPLEFTNGEGGTVQYFTRDELPGRIDGLFGDRVQDDRP